MEFSIREAGEYRFACDYEAEANGPVAVGTGVVEQISKTLMFSLMFDVWRDRGAWNRCRLWR
jgi:hypothetical protein